ncbi:unnamed protein product [Litomosoides sigmodontis]|uniref:Uncharacterized protein n=1 Tax=Litomosoides sigmodontis TaxID=42156 RepID=A0A3P6T0Y8_LITSI|nr:unnamed protein product [Litomosoides sigmodontis]
MNEEQRRSVFDRNPPFNSHRQQTEGINKPAAAAAVAVRGRLEAGAVTVRSVWHVPRRSRPLPLHLPHPDRLDRFQMFDACGSLNERLALLCHC